MKEQYTTETILLRGKFITRVSDPHDLNFALQCVMVVVHVMEENFLHFFSWKTMSKFFFPQLACASSSFIPPYQKLGQNSKKQKSYGQKNLKKAYLPIPFLLLLCLTPQQKTQHPAVICKTKIVIARLQKYPSFDQSLDQSQREITTDEMIKFIIIVES